MEIKYLNREHLTGFENYKYSSIDTSPLSKYVMHPFWNKVVLLCPKWVAPNLLTFLGFLFTLATFILLSWMDYEFYASTRDRPSYAKPLPNWVFLFTAFSLFMAYTLDGIDGKQARRTGTSGPLGELFDHGLDSISSALIPILMYHIFGRSGNNLTTWRLYLILWNVIVNFHLTHWEKYNTGVLFLPWSYDFSMWTVTMVFLIAGIYGHEVWDFTLPGNITSAQMFETTLYVSSSLTNLPPIFYNIYTSYKYKTGYMRSFSEAIRPLISVFILFALTTFWIIRAPNVLETDPHALFFMTGMIFSNICCRLIVAQMSQTRSELYNWLLFPMTITVFVSLLIQRVEVDLVLLYVLCIIATLGHIHYGTCVHEKPSQEQHRDTLDMNDSNYDIANQNKRKHQRKDATDTDDDIIMKKVKKHREKVRQMCDHFRIDCFRIRTHKD